MRRCGGRAVPGEAARTVWSGGPALRGRGPTRRRRPTRGAVGGALRPARSAAPCARRGRRRPQPGAGRDTLRVPRLPGLAVYGVVQAVRVGGDNAVKVSSYAAAVQVVSLAHQVLQVESWEVHGQRLCIPGRSAGGYTTLASLAFTGTFKAGASLYGILRLKAELAKSSSNPDKFLLEALHSTGYSGALANPLIASEYAISKLNADVLEQFIIENYTAPRIVLAASGVDHDELVSIAEPLLSDIPSVSGTTRPKSTYTGGEYRRSADSSNTDVALAFEVPSGWLKEKDFVTVSVLQTLLGGGGKFSWGRQRKGLQSRLILNMPTYESVSGKFRSK